MNINFFAPVNKTGYGIASLNIIKALSGIDNISYFPIGNPGTDNQKDYDLIVKLFSNKNFFDINAPCIKIWHQFDLASRVGRGRYIAYPFFELDTFNQMELKHLSVPDEIFVSSNWAKNIMVNNGIKSPIHIIPLGVDLSIFDYLKYSKINNDKYIFLNIGKWEIRKGHDLLPEIFKKAFPNQEDVELWILASETSSYSKPEEISNWHKYYSAHNIKIIRGVETHNDVANIIAQSDCGLYPSRAEGWNMELLETMAMNKPCIATNYSAHTEFCNKDNCYLIDITETEKAVDNKAFNGQGSWAKIGLNQIDQIIEYMRYAYNNRISNNPSGLKTANMYTWNNTAKIIHGCIS